MCKRRRKEWWYKVENGVCLSRKYKKNIVEQVLIETRMKQKPAFVEKCLWSRKCRAKTDVKLSVINMNCIALKWGLERESDEN
jgi:hypothetical protein